MNIDFLEKILSTLTEVIEIFITGITSLLGNRSHSHLHEMKLRGLKMVCIVVFIIFILLVIIFFAVVSKDEFLGDKEKTELVSVPSVEGLPYYQAISLLRSIDLTEKVICERDSIEWKNLVVKEQHPSAGDTVQAFTIVEIVLEPQGFNAQNPIIGAAFSGHFYCVYELDNILTWRDAKEFCRSKNGHLATISSQRENDFIYSLIIQSHVNAAYFGLNNEDGKGIWKWCNGEELSYTNWAPGEPNNWNGSENYALFYWNDDERYQTGLWNDGDFPDYSSGAKAFVCEWDESDPVNVFSINNAGDTP